jgi:hypothetical protein
MPSGTATTNLRIFERALVDLRAANGVKGTLLATRDGFLARADRMDAAGDLHVFCAIHAAALGAAVPQMGESHFVSRAVTPRTWPSSTRMPTATAS